LRERYRSLLSDLHDGAISVADARSRRDKLIDELRAVHDMTSLVSLDIDYTDTADASEKEGALANATG
jgi:hypothetical protein